MRCWSRLSVQARQSCPAVEPLLTRGFFLPHHRAAEAQLGPMTAKLCVLATGARWSHRTICSKSYVRLENG